MNGKKYEFTPEVLQSGNKLFNTFKSTQTSLRNIYNKTCDEATVTSIVFIKEDISRTLSQFDKYWVEYESVYA